jgi:hypothetical protein
MHSMKQNAPGVALKTYLPAEPAALGPGRMSPRPSEDSRSGRTNAVAGNAAQPGPPGAEPFNPTQMRMNHRFRYSR